MKQLESIGPSVLVRSGKGELMVKMSSIFHDVLE